MTHMGKKEKEKREGSEGRTEKAQLIFQISNTSGKLRCFKYLDDAYISKIRRLF